MKIRIQNDGGPGFQTKITSVETGQTLNYVTEADIHIEWGATDSIPTVRLTQLFPVVDIIADAEIKQICPCCGQATGGETAEADIRDGSGRRWKGRMYAVENEQ